MKRKKSQIPKQEQLECAVDGLSIIVTENKNVKRKRF